MDGYEIKIFTSNKMPNHTTTAYNAVKNAIEKNNKKSGKSMLRKAKTNANKNMKGAGNSKAMLKGAANYLANHPNSKKAQKVVKEAVKKM